MKNNNVSTVGVLFLLLVSIAMSGCASRNIVQKHKGEGPRRAMAGSEAELMDTAEKSMVESGYRVTREPHAVFASHTSTSITYTFYFFPTQNSNQTEVEILIASPWLSEKQLQQFQLDSFQGTFPISYISMKLQEKEYDPNKKEGQLLALSLAAFMESRDTAKKLIYKGANIDLAIKELKELASSNTPYLDKPANKKTYDKANVGVDMLNGLKKETEGLIRAAKRMESEKENDVSFQEALSAYQAAFVKPQLPEEARKFKVQAEGAIRDKDFIGAVELYGKALKIAPWWPEGHFNRALVLGEVGEFDPAMMEMGRYIKLVPNAPNARTAQDKIYDWERKVSKEK